MASELSNDMSGHKGFTDLFIGKNTQRFVNPKQLSFFFFGSSHTESFSDIKENGGFIDFYSNTLQSIRHVKNSALYIKLLDLGVVTSRVSFIFKRFVAVINPCFHRDEFRRNCFVNKCLNCRKVIIPINTPNAPTIKPMRKLLKISKVLEYT